MRILHVTASLGMGGAETQLVQLAGHQARDGHDVSIISLLDTCEVPIPAGVNWAAVGARAPLGRIAAIWRLARAIRTLRPEIVHAHMLHSNLLTRILRPILRIPLLVNTVHAVRETGSVFYKWAYRTLDRLADVTAFVSEEALSRYRSEQLVSNERSVVVHNGIDLERFHPRQGIKLVMREAFGFDGSDIVIIAIGRLTADKDYPNLFDAFDILVLEHPGARLLIVGDGELEAVLKVEVGQRDWASRVCFAGLRHDIPELLGAADLLVLASANEGFGLVLAEAMACGVPVVATRCGGTVEVVGKCGVLVPPRDPQALADGIGSLLSLSEDALESLVNAARDRVNELFSMDSTSSNWYGVYDRARAGRDGR